MTRGPGFVGDSIFFARSYPSEKNKETDCRRQRSAFGRAMPQLTIAFKRLTIAVESL
jgi:hypothetical protein